MSEQFIASAFVSIRPDLRVFEKELRAKLAAIHIAPIAIPIAAASAGIAGATAATAALRVVQAQTEKTTLGLASGAQVESSTFGKQAVILKAATANTLELAGAQAAAAKTSAQTTSAFLGAGSASAKLDAGLLGLRTALGSTAVIGLGAAALAAIAFGKGLRAVIGATAAFEQELNTFQATAGATAEEMRAVSAAAQRLGADVRLPAVSAADAAVAMTELAKAGLSVQDAIAGAEGVLQLATAAQIDNQQASLIAASALNAFGLAGDQAVRVADDLANAANAAQGSIADFGLAMQQAAAVARQVGFSLEDTTAILTLLAKNGLRGSDAGTSLRTALIRLVAPSKEAAAVIQTLGISIRDAQGNVRPDVFAQFAEATSALGPAMRDAVTALVFGQDSIRAVAIAGREGAKGLRLVRFEIDQEGTAARVAGARTQGLAGSFAALQSNAETLGITLGSFVKGPLADTLSGLAKVASGLELATQKFSDFSQKIKGGLPGGKGKDSFFGTLFGDLDRLLIPGGGFSVIGDILGKTVLSAGDAAEKIKKLTEELNNLQKARILAEAGGATGIADALTQQIKDLRAEINAVKISAGQIIPPQTKAEKQIANLRKGLEDLQNVAIARRARGADTSDVDASILKTREAIRQGLRDSARDAEEVGKQGVAALANNIQSVLKLLVINPAEADKPVAQVRALVAKIAALGPQSGAAGKKIALELIKAIQDAITIAANAGNLGAAKALKKLADRLAAGFQGDITSAFKGIKVPLLADEIAAALTPSQVEVSRAKALGGDVTGALQDERQVVLDLIAKKRAAGQELGGLFDDLASIDAELKGIQEQAVADQKERQQKQEADFITGMENALKPSERLAIRADRTESLKDDIKFQKQIIAILRAKQAAVLKILGNTAGARKIISDIQDRILTEAGKLRTDQQNFRKQLRDALVATIERIRTGIQLDVDLADINENTKKRISLRQKLIQNLIKERKKLHLTGNALKENRNEIARINKEIEDIRGETKKSGDAFKQLTFSFLQTQQGFAANLLGNLIPGGATGGLVGGSSPAGQVTNPLTEDRFPTGGIKAEAGIAEAKGRGFSQGQGDTTNQLLRRILAALNALNGRASHPEARYQNRVAGSNMDMIGGV